MPTLRFACRAVLKAFVVLLLVGISSALADDADTVKEKLFKAKKDYDQEMLKYKQAVEESFDKRETTARAAGDKAAVDQIKIAREAFAQTGAVPTTLPATIKQQQTTARTNLDKAYTVALKGYLILKEDAAAEGVEKEQKEFKSKAPGGLSPLDVTTKDDLKKYLIGTTWDWAKMTFKGDGMTDVEWAGYSVAWDAVDRRTVCLRILKGRDQNKVAVIQFNEEMTEFRGYDFDSSKLSPKRKK